MSNRKKSDVIFWGLDAKDLEIDSPSSFPEEELTNSYAPGYELALGEDWSSSDYKQAEWLVPETQYSLHIPTKHFHQHHFSVTNLKILEFFRLFVEIKYGKPHEEVQLKERRGTFDFSFQNI